MNVRTIAATLVLIGGMAAGTATANATPASDNAANVTVCHREGNGSSHSITVSVQSVIDAHLRHGDSLGLCPVPTPAPTGTGTPTASPTPQGTAGFDNGSDDPCVNHPFLNAHNQPRVNRPNVWMQDTDCGQYIVETPTPRAQPSPSPTVTPTSAPVPTFTPSTGNPPLIVPVAVPDFDITTIKALPHAGDGSLNEVMVSEASLSD